MVTYIFLIIVVGSSPKMQVEPMESMAQCTAAIKAIKIADEQRSWSEISPYVDNVKCVEVRP